MIQEQTAIDRNLATYVGIDAHPSEHTALAMSRFEDRKGQLRFENTKAGISEFLHWLPTVDNKTGNIILGIEGGSGARRALLTQLLQTYPHVYEVNPLYTKQRRAFGTRSDKSDPFDAKLIAEVLTRKLSELPQITQKEFSSRMLCLKKMVWFYEETTMQGTRLKNQLHQVKRELELSSNREEKRVLQLIVKDKTRELRSIQKRQTHLTRELNKLLEGHGKNLTTFQGVGIISAAKVVAYTNGVERFKTVDKFLRYAGIAPKEKSSGKAKGHRQNTMGNRNLNTALYMVALNQLTKNQKAREYFEKKVKEGKTKKHALRCLMKRTGSIVYGLLKSGEDYRT
jgi:transposase